MAGRSEKIEAVKAGAKEAIEANTTDIAAMKGMYLPKALTMPSHSPTVLYQAGFLHCSKERQ